MSELEGRYPRDVQLGEESITLTLLGTEDAADLLAFAAELPPHDLLFLSRDIREPKVQEAWLNKIATGEIISIAARAAGRIVGTTAVVIDKLSFSAHVGELRILVSGTARQMGLGRKLIQEAFLVGVDQGLEKLTARMTLDQDAAIAVFEELGFKREALYCDYVKDKEGRKHDLLVMSRDVDSFYSQLQAYGLDTIA